MTTKFTRHLSILLTAMIPCLCSAEKEEETEAPNDSYTVENFNGVPFIAKTANPSAEECSSADIPEATDTR